MSFKNILLFLLFFSTHLFCEGVKDENMAHGIDKYKNNKYQDSIYYFNMVLEANNNLSSEALFWKASSLYKLGYYTEAIIDLELLFREGSITTAYYEDSRFLYCKVFFKIEKYAEALLLFNQFSRNQSFNYYSDSAFFWIGECYLQLSKLEEAKRSFMEYLNVRPSSLNAKNRIELIESMLEILEKDLNSELTLIDRANWLSDYVLKEKYSKNSTDITDFLGSFKNRDEFFFWLKNFDIVKKDNFSEDESTSDRDTINELDFLERAILDELEDKLLDELGDK